MRRPKPDPVSPTILEVIELRQPWSLQLFIITGGVVFKYLLTMVLMNGGRLVGFHLGLPRIAGSVIIATAVMVGMQYFRKSRPPTKTNRRFRYLSWFGAGIGFEAVIGDFFPGGLPGV